MSLHVRNFDSYRFAVSSRIFCLLKAPENFKNVYPERKEDAVLAVHHVLEDTKLCDVLAAVHDVDSLKVVDFLALLEKFQVPLARCKVQAAEEEQVASGDFQAFFRAQPDGMAGALMELDGAFQSLIRAHAIGGWPEAKADHNVDGIVAKSKELLNQQQETTFKLWKDCLIKVMRCSFALRCAVLSRRA